jgi:hypothetical protein
MGEGGGREAVQIDVAGNEKQSYAAMAAVTTDGKKHLLFTIVRDKRSE